MQIELNRRRAGARRRPSLVPLLLIAVLAACEADAIDLRGPYDDPGLARVVPENSALPARGREVFRFDTFGNESFWTDTARLHEVIASTVSPALALEVGLKVDADALPPGVKEAILSGEVDLTDPATTVALLKLDAVLGVRGKVEEIEGADRLTAVGITCALCHSSVDDSFSPGIGRRMDGWANTDLDVGRIVALSPAIPDELKAIMRGWGPGMYDPRINIDGMNTPVVIPPAYGLDGIALETYTGDGPVTYWNAYVAVTQMHGQGTFRDPRLGINIVRTPDLVSPKLAALRQYQLTLRTPEAPAGSFDAAAAERGAALFSGKASCSSCHLPGEGFTDVNDRILHEAAETGMDPAYARRSATGLYRTTPLRGLWQRNRFFHDGSAESLAEVVVHYDTVLGLGLSGDERRDLEEYLRSL